VGIATGTVVVGDLVVEGTAVGADRKLSHF